MIEQTPERVFAVSSGSLFSIGKDEHDIQTYSKVNGLNGNGIVQIKYDEVSKQLIIIYSDGNIDLLSSSGIVNIPDLYLKVMNVEKTVNHILCYQGNAYLSTNFGILVLNLKKGEIGETYYIGENSSNVTVLATDIFNGQIYACTPNYIYSANMNSNLVDFRYWSTGGNYPGTGEFQSLTSLNEHSFVLRAGKVYRKSNSGNEWQLLHDNVLKMTQAGSKVYVFWTAEVGIYQQNMDFSVTGSPEGEKVNDFLQIGNLNLYALDIQGVAFEQSGSVSYFKPDGPLFPTAHQLTFAGDKLYVLHGANSTYTPVLNPNVGVSILSNNRWKTISTAEMDTPQPRILDFVNMAVDPNDFSRFFVASWGTGLYEFRNDEFYEHYTYTNSILEYHPLPAIPEHDRKYYVRINGLSFDKHSNLTMINCGVNNGIKILLNDGTWYAAPRYPNTSVMQTSGPIGTNLLNPNQKWALSMWNPTGILVYDDNGTVANAGDDKAEFFLKFNYVKNGEIVSTEATYYYCFAQDKKGTIWIGTNLGPLLFNNTDKIFNSDYLASKALIPRNDTTGLGDFLLDNEAVRSIAIDGANRKWIGTQQSGVYLLSENGLETIHHFTSENSPLPDNFVQSIAVHPITGEVFFGTSEGMVSYQSDAAEPQPTFSNISVYPNPVRADFQGVVTISGLVENSLVRITDASGNAVYQTTSNGSIATWDIRDSFGNRASTGVYVVMAASADGSMRAAAKILVFK
jgi:hypothetical protein